MSLNQGLGDSVGPACQTNLVAETPKRRVAKKVAPMRVVKQPLSVTHPELAKQAVGWDPGRFTHGSNKLKLWKCTLNHEWVAAIYSRASGKGCPFCANQLIFPGFNDLETTHPILAREALGWDPKTVTGGSNKKFGWICSKGHEWTAALYLRTAGQGCPFCSGHRVTTGSTDLKAKYPELAKQAVGWDPSMMSVGSSKRVLWQCDLGHQWSATVSSRKSGLGCPVCSNKKVYIGFNDLATTNPELAKQAVGWDPTTVTKGSHKRVVWGCSEGHEWSTTIKDRSRYQTGCPVCSNKQILIGVNDLASTHPEIAAQASDWDPRTVTRGAFKKLLWKCKLNHEWSATVLDRTNGHGCPYCSNRKLLVGFNDLKTLSPGLSTEAEGWDPRLVLNGSHRKLRWKYVNGHSWEAAPYSRVSGKDCPFCSNTRVQIGFNDLATTYPDLSKEANGWDPKTVVSGSGRKVAWRCGLGHLWNATVKDRVQGSECPTCSNRVVLAGFNDLLTTNPSLASEAYGWNPSTVNEGTHQKLNWKCREGHVWKADVSSRTGGRGCPSCAFSGFDPNSEGWLYFLSHSSWEMLQIGITNFPDQRLGNHKKLGWELVEIRGPMDGLIAREWETSILQMLKRNGAKLAPEEVVGKFDGYTEAWLTNSYPVKSLRELMDTVRKDEARNESISK